MRKEQTGFTLIEALIIIVVVGVIGTIAWVSFKGDKSVKPNEDYNMRQESNQDPSTLTDQPETNKSESEDTPPLLIKHLGVNLDAYDPATSMAGDFKFTKMKLQFDRIFMGYGFFIPSSTASQEKYNPQPTFILPLGTKVYSLIDGVVTDIPKLYSNDYSVMVAKDKNSQFIYETEHVINPVVKVGDKVKAGQVLAEVSDYDTKNTPGFGLVEIGILQGGNPPKHICPFNYLDPSIKQETFTKIKAFYKSWEEYKGDTSLYDENEPVTGCAKLDAIEG